MKLPVKCGVPVLVFMMACGDVAETITDATGGGDGGTGSDPGSGSGGGDDGGTGEDGGGTNLSSGLRVYYYTENDGMFQSFCAYLTFVEGAEATLNDVEEFALNDVVFYTDANVGTMGLVHVFIEDYESEDFQYEVEIITGEAQYMVSTDEDTVDLTVNSQGEVFVYRYDGIYQVTDGQMTEVIDVIDNTYTFGSSGPDSSYDGWFMACSESNGNKCVAIDLDAMRVQEFAEPDRRYACFGLFHDGTDLFGSCWEGSDYEVATFRNITTWDAIVEDVEPVNGDPAGFGGVAYFLDDDVIYRMTIDGAITSSTLPEGAIEGEVTGFTLIE